MNEDNNTNLGNNIDLFEKPSDAGRGQKGIVKRWIAGINLSIKEEENWRKEAQEAIKVFRGKKNSQNHYNIYWSNIEVLLPNLYTNIPRPDVRPLFKDGNPVAKVMSKVLERCLVYALNTCDFSYVMSMAVLDYIRQGRGQVRVELDTKDTDAGTIVAVYPKLVDWESYVRGSGRNYNEQTWCAYIHHLTYEEFIKHFDKDLWQYCNADSSQDNKDDGKTKDPDIYKTVTVYELWDKESREVLWLSPSYEDGILLNEGDKTNLTNFFDCPRPLVSLLDSTSQTPVVEYNLYSSLARQLNEITQRIEDIISCMRVRGIYDATLGELADIMSSEYDGMLIPTQNSTMALQAGGFERAIWFLPIDKMAIVLRELFLQRQQLISSIYEITGLSDIMRGSSNPNETLGAQEIKASNAATRIKTRQKEVQRFIRDIMRLMAELIAEQYPAALMTTISGIPVSEEMKQYLVNDISRGIMIDIETDSTIEPDLALERKEIIETMEAVGGFTTNFGALVQAKAISPEAAKKVLFGILRKLKLGSEVEEILAAESEAPVNTEQTPSPEQIAAEQQTQQKMMEIQNNIQQKQMDREASLQSEQMRLEQDGQLRREELALQQQKIIADNQLRLNEISARLQEHQANMDLAYAKLNQERLREIESAQSNDSGNINADYDLKMKQLQDAGDREILSKLLDLDLEERCQDRKHNLELKRLALEARGQNIEDEDLAKLMSYDFTKEKEKEEPETPPIDLSPVVEAIQKMVNQKTRIRVTADEDGNIDGEIIKE